MEVQLKKGRSGPVWFGHPWIFSGAIGKEPKAAAGEIVDVTDDSGKWIARGFYNPQSQIRVRVVTTEDRPVDAEFLRARLQAAVALRARLGFPNAQTNAYRLVNSEGDGLPGVTIDVYGDAIAVQFGILGMKQRETIIFDALAEIFPHANLFESAPGGFADIEGFTAAARLVRGKQQLPVTCRENGLTFEVDPLGGQKTGMFLDQRENRARIGELAKDARVLDVYTYAGGFALHALKGGAKSAVCVDASARALERAAKHAALNNLGPLEIVESDAFRYLEQVTPRSFDLVIVDPPKFARARKDLAAALKGYTRLNTLALTACAPGAILVSCSCSQLVDVAEFERMLAHAARDAGRRINVIEMRSQGADHPLPPSFPEGRYLKVAIVSIY